MFAGAKEDRADRNVDLVDQFGLKILPDRGNPSAESNVSAPGGIVRPLQCDMDAFCDEVEGRAAFHDDCGSGVIREHEDGSVVRGIVAPPSLPVVIRPGTADRSEHVTAEDPCPDIGKATRHEVVIDVARATIFTLHLPKSAGGDHPIMQGEAADAQRVVETLMRSGAVTVEGYGEVMDAKL